jgi:hypothetical protein
MPKMIANRSMYYAGGRVPGERFDAPEPHARMFVQAGKARYEAATEETPTVPRRRRYRRADMQAEA